MYIVYFRSDDAREIENIMIVDNLSDEILNHPRYAFNFDVPDLPENVNKYLKELPRNELFPKSIIVDHLILMEE